VLLKVTSPGVPDFYQGTELWDLSLVDPDNRRPVDFQRRMRYLAEMKTKAQSDSKKLIRELLASREDGRIKLFLTHRLLSARRAWSPLFRDGSYMALQVGGQFHEHVIAFARNLGNAWAITVAPRLLTGVIEENEEPLGASVWKDTAILLPEETPRRWNNMITDEITTTTGALAVGTALEHFPVALLINEEQK
jgi:(1->4)-alpha-D-glucan 1-alpha-D-glucosylmutase